LIAAHEGFPIDLCKQLFFAFMAFNFCASSVYLINDLLDIDSDRRHPRKAQRPLASGALSIKNGVILAIASASVSLALAITLVNSNFILWLSIYFLTTFAYTSILKKIAIVDCLTLSALYTLRIIAGAATIIIPLSFWLLAFSLFIFFSLALAKRYTELLIDPSSISKKIYGRGYFTSDAPYILILGLSASFASVLVLALYLNSDKVLKLYQTPEFAFGAIPPMLFWLSYIWLKAFRGELDDDPIVFAARNKTSWITLALIIFFLTLASFS
jgi:4-hydroxybenzoate polyprenyltransferase